MSMEINNVYNNYVGSYMNEKNAKQIKSAKVPEKSSMTEGKNSVVNKSNEEYLRGLQKQVPYIKLQAGNGLNLKRDGQVNVVDVSPNLLDKMKNDPESAKKYTQRLKDVEAAYKWADGYHKMMGYTVECRHGYVDDNGEFTNFAVVLRTDSLNEKLRKEAADNASKRIEKTRENMRNKVDEIKERIDEKKADKTTKKEDENAAGKTVEEMLEKKMDESQDGSIYLNSDEMQQIIDKSREESGDTKEEKATGMYLNLGI